MADSKSTTASDPKANHSIDLQKQLDAALAENAELKAQLAKLTVESGKPLRVNVGKQAYDLVGKAISFHPRTSTKDEKVLALAGTYPIAEAAKNQALLKHLAEIGHGQLVAVND